jgi:hypothetical protein
LPEGGHGLQLSCSGWPAVLGVDADSGTPYGDFSEEGEARVAARRCPYRLFTVLAGTVSDLICEPDDELRPLRSDTHPKRDDHEALTVCREATVAVQALWIPARGAAT